MTTLLHLEGGHDESYRTRFIATIEKARKDYVVLDRSRFYPVGGGQPHDTGVLEIDGVNVPVIMVAKKGIIKHHLELPDDITIEDGAEVHGVVDWDRRYAHMQMHTAQHLVSAVMDEVWSAATVGNQVGGEKSRIDFGIEEKLDSSQLSELASRCNELIRSELEIRQLVLPRPEVVADPLVRVNLDRLPPSISELRVIEIDGVDRCPCAGTHVRNTREIGQVKILQAPSKGAGTQRIYYELTNRPYSEPEDAA